MPQYVVELTNRTEIIEAASRKEAAKIAYQRFTHWIRLKRIEQHQ